MGANRTRRAVGGDDDQPVEARTVCAFGSPLTDHYPFALPLFACQGCRDECVRLRVEFRAAVARGEYDEQGYTPNERKAQARRLKELGR